MNYEYLDSKIKNKKIMKNLYLIIFSTAFAVLVCEFSLGLMNFSKYKNQKKIYAYEWKEILTTTNIEQYVAPKSFLSLKTDSQTMFPLSQVSNKRILVCNEKDWVIIDTDRYGFNNLDSSWDQEVDFVVIGDSFAFGFCVDSKNNFVSNLSSFSNLNGINLGQGGNGPLLSFATLKEFGIALNPKKVIHLIYENDILDFDIELKNSFLTQTYLDNDKSQNLILNKKKVDNLLMNTPKLNIDYIYKKKVERYNNIYKQILKKTWHLGNLREKFSLVRKTDLNKDYNKVFNFLKKINRYLNNKNIDYYVVVITDPTNKTKIKNKELAKFISQISKEKIKYINSDDIFNDFKKKEYWRGHYNELGYKILAKNFQKNIE